MHKSLLTFAFATLAGCLLMGGFQNRLEAAGDGSEILIREGVELRRAGRNEEALAKFVRAYQVSHSPRAAAQLGLCEQALSQWADADLHLAEALAAVSDPWVAGHRATIESSLNLARRNLGTVRVHGTPKGALVMVNDALAGQFPEQTLVRVKPGSVRVSVSAAGHTTVQREYSVDAGETKDVQIDLPTAQQVAMQPVGSDRVAPPQAVTHAPTKPLEVSAAAERAEDTSISYKLGVGSLITAGVALAFGAGSHLAREGKAKDFNKSPAACDRTDDVVFGGESCQSLADSYDKFGTWMVVGYAAAAVFGAGGLALVLLSPKNNTAEGVALKGCAPFATSAGIACSGTF